MANHGSPEISGERRERADPVSPAATICPRRELSRPEGQPELSRACRRNSPTPKTASSACAASIMPTCETTTIASRCFRRISWPALSASRNESSLRLRTSCSARVRRQHQLRPKKTIMRIGVFCIRGYDDPGPPPGVAGRSILISGPGPLAGGFAASAGAVPAGLPAGDFDASAGGLA